MFKYYILIVPVNNETLVSEIKTIQAFTGMKAIEKLAKMLERQQQGLSSKYSYRLFKNLKNAEKSLKRLSC